MTKVLILKILYDGKFHTSKELAEKLEISPSTVRQIISYLKDIGTKIKSIRGRYGGYMLLDKNNIW